MESQPQNPEFRINAETFYHALTHISLASFLWDISMYIVETQIRYRRPRSLIRISTVCLKNIQLNLNKNTIQHP